MSKVTHPFTSAPPAEIPLPKAPLVRVIAQVRFPSILSIEKREFVAPFQEAIRARYPVLRAEQTHGISFGPQGASSTAPQILWRFADEANRWRVSLAQDFATIETTAYASRADFFSRFEAMITALTKHVGPRTVDRIGVRYIDRVTGDALANINHLIRPEILGIVASEAAQQATHALTESVFTVTAPSTQLLTRWGLLPEGGTVDPAAIEPLAEASWILDLDMFRADSRLFNPPEIVAEARGYAERIYTFFRWAVTDEFLQWYGGEV